MFCFFVLFYLVALFILLNFLNFRVASYRKVTRIVEYPCTHTCFPPSLASGVRVARLSPFMNEYWRAVIHWPPYFNFLVLNLTSFSHLRCHGTSNRHVSLGSSCLWQFLRLFLFSMTLTVSSCTIQVFCGMTFSWHLVDFFPHSKYSLPQYSLLFPLLMTAKIIGFFLKFTLAAPLLFVDVIWRS